MAEENLVCVICCNRIEDDYSTVKTEKGVNSLVNALRERGLDYENININDKVHVACRKDVTNKKALLNLVARKKNIITKSPRKSLRVRAKENSRKTRCIFCNVLVSPMSREYGYVKTDGFTNSILRTCSERNDEWAHLVKGKVEYYQFDLHAFDVIYHHQCYFNFVTKKNVPNEYAAKMDLPLKKTHSKVGRPENAAQKNAFLQVCQFINDKEEDQFTFEQLSLKMKEFLNDTNETVYSSKYIKSRLREEFGDEILFSSSPGKADVITIKRTANSIIRQCFENCKSSSIESQEQTLIETAAKLIMNDIKENVPSSKEFYPSPDSLSLENCTSYLPKTLFTFLQTVITTKKNEKQIAAIGQALIQACKPRSVLAPVQIGLAAQLHHLYRSRFLIDSLNALGFCSSYYEVELFEKNAALHGSSNMDLHLNELANKPSILFAADNVDHNICTLTGNGTFHGMGMIAIIDKPGMFSNVGRIRRATPPSHSEILSRASVQINEYHQAKGKVASVKLKALPDLNYVPSSLDTLWHCSYFFREPSPLWSGFMHIVHDKYTSSKSSIFFLPIIDLNPSDMNCIYSTLNYTNKIAYAQNQPHIIAFDQPLFFKASIIVETDKNFSKSCPLLGTFHTTMNFLGAIGYIMDGSGIRNIFSQIYSDSTINHVMSGKAYSRSLRGHLLIDISLSTLLLKMIPTFDVEMLEGEYIRYKSNKDAKVEVLEKSVELNTVNKQLMDVCGSFYFSSNHTAQLWLEYRKLISILRMMIRADRTANWSLHLKAIRLSLPIFPAAGHHNYAKSVYLYYQKMVNLEFDNPAAYNMLKSGNFVSRRSKRFYAGLAPDLTIEQVLMRSLKSRGGLTRGTGFGDLQRSVWLFSMPTLATFNYAMQNFTGFSFETSEQHKELGATRLQKDRGDVETILEYITELNPFAERVGLINIATGIESNDDSIEIHKFADIGSNLISRMIGVNVFEYKFSRKDSAKNIASMVLIKDLEADVSIDSDLLFQRLLVMTSSFGDKKLTDVFEYELCAYPPSLFESINLPNKADKPPLAKALAKEASNKIIDPQENHIELFGNGDESADITMMILEQDLIPIEIEHPQQTFILDGGALLYRLKWQKNKTYNEIATYYCNFVKKTYGENVVIVFDGYNGPSTKDMTHHRRNKGKQYVTIHFTSEMKFKGKKEDFLSNVENKKKFIDMLICNFRENGLTAVQSRGDADLLVVKEALKAVEIMDTVVIGEDTDILVLLLFHSVSHNYNFSLFFRSDKVNSQVDHDISYYKTVLGHDICKSLLFLHSFTGCDTTSSLTTIGKPTALKKLIAQRDLQSIACQFLQTKRSHVDIKRLGEEAAKILYGYKDAEDLNILRFEIFKRKIGNAKKNVESKSLPPTVSALQFHSYRCYFQVHDWITLNCKLDPLQWGWKEKSGRLIPVSTDRQPAPKYLLDNLRCKCQTGCISLRCSCRKNNLRCTYACGVCQTTNCLNVERIDNYAEDNEKLSGILV